METKLVQQKKVVCHIVGQVVRDVHVNKELKQRVFE